MKEDYDRVGDAYAAQVDRNPVHSLYARPALLSLIPEDLSGKRVLDAGCGTGWYAEQMLARGAIVTGIDLSETMLAYARRKLGGRATFVQHDLSEPLPFADAGFDLVLSALAIHYVRDYDALFRELARVLKPGGTIVLATHHAVHEVEYQKPASYFDTEQFEDEWKDVGKVRYWRRPLGAVLQPMLDAGLQLQRISEPRPLEMMETIAPDTYATLQARPFFLLLRAGKAPA